MKKFIIALALSIIAAGAIAADVQVDGYYRKDGTYVQPHHRTSPDSRRDNNYGSQGNINPYTGQMGTRDPYAQPQPQPYGQSPQNNIFDSVQPRQRQNNIFDPVQPRRR